MSLKEGISITESFANFKKKKKNKKTKDEKEITTYVVLREAFYRKDVAFSWCGASARANK